MTPGQGQKQAQAGAGKAGALPNLPVFCGHLPKMPPPDPTARSSLSCDLHLNSSQSAANLDHQLKMTGTPNMNFRIWEPRCALALLAGAASADYA